ncbi:ATP-binding protein [Pseudonocardia sp. GCM10023141]|uniref:ATP-binding protein n=1 Tax=Pseudonocardia sp. GCM10023141 TaxID=3252653 RepID=UPI0036181C1F
MQVIRYSIVRMLVRCMVSPRLRPARCTPVSPGSVRPPVSTTSSPARRRSIRQPCDGKVMLCALGSDETRERPAPSIDPRIRPPRGTRPAPWMHLLDHPRDDRAAGARPRAPHPQRMCRGGTARHARPQHLSAAARQVARAGRRPAGRAGRGAVSRFLPSSRSVEEAVSRRRCRGGGGEEAVAGPPDRRRRQLDLECEPGAARVARRWIRDVCTQWGIEAEEACESVVLVGSELVDNMVRHARTAGRLRLEQHSRGLSVTVTDAADSPPVHRPARAVGRRARPAHPRHPHPRHPCPRHPCPRPVRRPRGRRPRSRSGRPRRGRPPRRARLPAVPRAPPCPFLRPRRTGGVVGVLSAQAVPARAAGRWVWRPGAASIRPRHRFGCGDRGITQSPCASAGTAIPTLLVHDGWADEEGSWRECR